MNTATVLFESDEFVIVDKPAGLPTAPLVRTETRSLAAALLARYPEMAGVGFREREPGLVHRLDNETSGVVLAARTQAAFQTARSLFESSLLEKRYLAVVAKDAPAQGELTTLLGPDPANPKSVRVFAEPPDGYAKECHTSYKVLERGEKIELLVDKTEVLDQHAFKFKKQSRKLKNSMWWKNVKLMILIAVMIIVRPPVLAAGLCSLAWLIDCAAFALQVIIYVILASAW